MAFMLQAPLDPSAYSASWGVLGALVFVIVVLAGVVYAVFIRGAAEAQKRTDSFLEFTTDHSQRHVVALDNLGEKIRSGDERLAQALEYTARLNRSVLVAWEALARARALKAGGGALTSAEVDSIIRSANEMVHRSNGG